MKVHDHRIGQLLFARQFCLHPQYQPQSVLGYLADEGFYSARDRYVRTGAMPDNEDEDERQFMDSESWLW